MYAALDHYQHMGVKGKLRVSPKPAWMAKVDNLPAAISRVISICGISISGGGRCPVPANSFAEYAPQPNLETKKKDVVWFALNGAVRCSPSGVWTTFSGDRGATVYAS